MFYTETASVDVNTALYSKSTGAELQKEHNMNKLVLIGSENKYFTTYVKEFILTKKFF